MTQEEKQLLVQDLCGRLPYGVQGITSEGEVSPLLTRGEADWDILTSLNYRIVKHGWRPYLRPMSSMTEGEMKEYRSLSDEVVCTYGPYNRECKFHCVRLGIKPDNPHECIDDYLNMEAIDWLNAHHFDYRGLISMGLGIDCTGLNIYKNEKSI